MLIFITVSTIVIPNAILRIMFYLDLEMRVCVNEIYVCIVLYYVRDELESIGPMYFEVVCKAPRAIASV
jgi:hypothetical protein